MSAAIRTSAGFCVCATAALVASLAGCQAPLRPIFPEISPAIVWPPPPDKPRIRYIGELRGESSLGVQPSGWQSIQAALTGPRPTIEFSRPSAVAVAGERVYVTDTGLAAVHLLDLSARRYTLLHGNPAERLQTPIDLTLAGADTLVVVDRGRAAVDLLNVDGTWRATLHWPEIPAPVAATWDAMAQRLWLADVAAHACFPIDQLQTLQPPLGGRGGAPGQFNYPTALAWHRATGLIVADAMNFRVQTFDDAGRPTAVFGQKGDAAGDFARPRGVAADSDGHIYVVDNQFENVQIFSRDGQLLMAFGQSGQGRGEFALPAGITIDDQDRIWIADSYNRRVQVFQYLREES